MLENILVYGLTYSGLYAMLAVGFSLVFGVARIINLAHTAFFMTAAYAIYSFVYLTGTPAWAAVLLSIIFTTILGIFFYHFFINPVREHETAMLIVTVAVALCLQELVLVFFGGYYRGVPSLIRGFVSVIGVRVSNQHLLVFGVVIITLILLWQLLMKTRIGIAIRATAQDREVANLMGINVSRIATWTMGISVFLAALAGAVVAPLYTLSPLMWLHPLVIVLATVILGGLGSIKGSFVGALILAFSEVMVIFLVPGGQFLRIPMAMAIMVLILIVRPEGLYGIYFEGER